MLYQQVINFNKIYILNAKINQVKKLFTDPKAGIIKNIISYKIHY